MTAAEENTASGHEAAPPTLTSADTELVHRHLDEFTAHIGGQIPGTHAVGAQNIELRVRAGQLRRGERFDVKNSPKSGEDGEPCPDVPVPCGCALDVHPAE